MGYKVTCGCGHEREITKEQYKNGWIPDFCWDCWRKKKEAERKNESEILRDEQLEKGYPALEGTEKQVLWAYKLRNLWIKAYEYLDEADYTHDEAFYKGKEALENLLLKETNSKFYINNSHIEMYESVYGYINNLIFAD